MKNWGCETMAIDWYSHGYRMVYDGESVFFHVFCYQLMVFSKAWFMAQ